MSAHHIVGWTRLLRWRRRRVGSRRGVALCGNQSAAPRLWAAVAVLMLSLAGWPAWGQRQAPADVIAVDVKELSNAVRVTIRGDGVLNLEPWSFFERAWQPNATGDDWEPAKVRRIHFRLENCRSRVGAFVNIGRYPVSHIEIGVPTEDPLGLTLDVDVVLYRTAMNMSYKLWDQEREHGWPIDGIGYDLAVSADKRSIIVTVENDRFLDKPADRVLPGPGRPEECFVTAAGGRLTVTARYVPLRRLLGEIAARTGERFLVEDGLERTISLHLADVTLAQFLQALSAAYGVSLTRMNGEWAVGEGVVTSAANYFPSETRRIPLRYLAPADALDLLPNFLLKYVHTDTEGNALVASGPPMMLDKLSSDLQRLDVPPPQIEVSVVAAETWRRRDLEAALELSPASPRAQAEVVPRDGTLSYRRLDAAWFDARARLQALEQRGLLRVRAEPKATVLSGRTATLFVGRQHYIQIARQGWEGLSAELKAVPVGVSLSVTPWTGGGDISLAVTPEVTTIDEMDPVSGLPVIGVRRSHAHVQLRPGDTILISGLRLAQTDRRVRRIPILGDLPLVGSLFRRRTRIIDEADLVLFVTARET